EACDLQATSPERTHAEDRRHLFGTENRFGAVGGIVADGEVLDVESGLRQQPQTDVVECNRAPQSTAHRLRDVGSITAHIDERRNHYSEKDQQDDQARNVPFTELRHQRTSLNILDQRVSSKK